MQSIQAYATGPQVPPGRTTPHNYATSKEKKTKKKIIKTKQKKRSVDLI
jgi:hypothetical protein